MTTAAPERPDRAFFGHTFVFPSAQRATICAYVSGCALVRYDGFAMCRNIRILFNFDPPVTEEEIHAASVQFVRKISGFTKPSKANEPAFLAAIDQVAAASTRLLTSLKTEAHPRNREEEIAKAKARSAERYGR